MLNKSIQIIIVCYLPFCATLGGCAKYFDNDAFLSLPYRIDIPQGNVIDQSMINKLEPGMSKSKVIFIMGTPLLIDPFHSNRWEYIHSEISGNEVRTQRRLSLFFEGDRLTHIKGDINVVERLLSEEERIEAASIVIPDKSEKEGLFSRLFSSDEEKNDESGFFSDWLDKEDDDSKKDQAVVGPADGGGS